jgi:cellulose synthase/poly-beta-1,6-N-acetylglucosamine synthase-like glycosyltransferase
MWLAMELKTTEQTPFKYITYHLIFTAIFLQVVLLPGKVYPEYYIILGTVVFAAIVFCSARSYLLAYFAVKKKNPHNKLPNELPRVSLIIPSYNEEKVLERTIPTALAMDYPPDKLELVYVYESACTDRTEQIIQAFASRDSRIKAVRRKTKKGGKAAVTNYALQFATGDIIGIFDADHSLNSDLVRLAVAQLQVPNVKCVRGWCRTINRTQNLLTRLVAIERDVAERLCACGAWRMGGFCNFGGGHSFFRREVFDELGTFNEDILTEDIDFSVKIHGAGYQVAMLPQMQSWEESPTSLRSLISQRKRWIRGWIQIWRIHATSILKMKKATLFKRIDVLVSLTLSVISGLLVLLIPLKGLSALGFRTSSFDENLSFLLWLFITTTPGIISLLMWCLCREEKDPSGPEELLLIPLLIPYIIFWFCISWICLVDEFVLRWPFAYVKTERADEGLVPAELDTDLVTQLTTEEQVVLTEEVTEGLKVGSAKSLDT